MKVSIIAFTATGYVLATRLQACLNAAGMKTEKQRCRAGALHDWTGRHFAVADALIFIGASGIAVRAIAPYLQSKTSDPAVIVIDEGGRFVIPLLSGHIGGANRLAADISQMLAATAVITTATESSGVFAIDSWAAKNKISILNPERIKSVSARLLAGENIYLYSMFPVEGALPGGFTAVFDAGVERKLPGGLSVVAGKCLEDIDMISRKSSAFTYKPDVVVTVKTGAKKEALQLVPPVLTLGVGCRKGVAEEEIQKAFKKMLKKAGCHKEAVGRVCSIDLKAREQGLLAFCTALGLPLQTFSVEQLRALPGRFTASSFVQEITGVDNVCERSAVLGSKGELFVSKNVENGVALALALAPYTLRF